MSSASENDGGKTGERTGLAALVFDAKARSLFFQAVVALCIVVAIAIAVRNAGTNLAEQGREFGFDFFDRPSDIQILTTFGTWLIGYEPGQNTIWADSPMTNTIGSPVSGPRLS